MLQTLSKWSVLASFQFFILLFYGSLWNKERKWVYFLEWMSNIFIRKMGHCFLKRFSLLWIVVCNYLKWFRIFKNLFLIKIFFYLTETSGPPTFQKCEFSIGTSWFSCRNNVWEKRNKEKDYKELRLKSTTYGVNNYIDRNEVFG